MKVWIGRLLLFFAIFTLGYGLGKDSAASRATTVPPAPVAAGEDKVLVYYLHTTFRCVTCNSIERQARELVERDFAEEVATGKVEWHAANFQEREDLAKRYEISASTLVIVRIEDGVEAEYRRLDDVWQVFDQPEKFTAYVGEAIRDYLPEERP